MDDNDFIIAPIKAADVHVASAADASPAVTPAARQGTPFAAHLSRRGRIARASGIVGVVLLALVVLIVVTPVARSAVAGFVLGPTPSATTALTLGRDRFGVQDQVPWGILTIDGHAGPPIPPVQLATGGDLSQLQTFALARGRHQLEYRADPFPTLRCTVSVPAVPSDTCPLKTTYKEYRSAIPEARVLDLQDSIDRLPVTEAMRLTSAAQRALDVAAEAAAGTLESGDHYRDDHGRVVVASTVLHAVPTYTLDVAEKGSSDNGEVCAGLCATPSPFALLSADDWLLYGQVAFGWRYTDASGDVVLAVPATVTGTSRNLVLGARRVDGDWQVKVEPAISPAVQVQNPPLCLVGASALFDLLNTSGPTTRYPQHPSYHWRESSSPPDLGCVFGGSTVDDQGIATGPEVLVLSRCDVVLAVNPLAATDFPRLPWSSAHEQALAYASWPPAAASVAPGG